MTRVSRNARIDLYCFEDTGEYCYIVFDSEACGHMFATYEAAEAWLDAQERGV